MSQRIEEYALIGDTQTGALIGNDGSIDWLCLPRFDSGACFAALLGTREHGRWQLAPTDRIVLVERRYRDGTLILETDMETDEGAVRLIDFMPPRDSPPTLVRMVEGLRGVVRMRMDLVIRFDYGSLVPWVRRVDGALLAIAGPDAVTIRSDVETRGQDLSTVAEFIVGQGDRICFTMVWHPSTEGPAEPIDPLSAAERTRDWWYGWSAGDNLPGHWQHQVQRSLLTIKALTFAPTGGIVAALTTSLPEQLGGVRNWDYRFCWLRDAAFSLYSLIEAGHESEARAWREWLLRAVAGSPEQMQILYGVGGERRLVELEVPWLPGYEGSRPVRVGNAAASQFQMDVYGEVMDVLYLCREHGMPPEKHAWEIQRALLDFLEGKWMEPDEGIWEVRGKRRYFTHSKMMAWVAMDRAVRSVERWKLEGPVDRWRAARDAIHREVCERGWSSSRKAFTQSYGSSRLDASLLRMAPVGFLPAEDERVQATVRAIEAELMSGGFVMRYSHDVGTCELDGLPPGEGVFLPCTLWLADNYLLAGRREEAVALFERVVGVANDVGLLSEEYDPQGRRLLGNFPQAFTHLAVVNTAFNLFTDRGPAHRRGGP